MSLHPPPAGALLRTVLAAAAFADPEEGGKFESDGGECSGICTGDGDGTFVIARTQAHIADAEALAECGTLLRCYLAFPCFKHV